MPGRQRALIAPAGVFAARETLCLLPNAPWVYWCMCRCSGVIVGVQSDADTEADEAWANFVDRPQLTCCVDRAGCTHVYTGELDETAG